MALPPLRNIYALGRTYAAHAEELGNKLEADPLIFMKPASAVVPSGSVVSLPQDVGACHHEVELALLIGAPLHRATSEASAAAIVGYGLAIDLTLRELQAKLKARGRPWERAKAFEGSCPLSPLLPCAEFPGVEEAELRLWINGEARQRGQPRDMILSLPELVAFVSRSFVLRPGDLILTGTPPGVGPVVDGDRLLATLGEKLRLEISFSAL